MPNKTTIIKKLNKIISDLEKWQNSLSLNHGQMADVNKAKEILMRLLDQLEQNE